MEWIIPANKKVYDHASAFKKWGYIDWQQNVNYSVGDIVYVYCAKPIKKIMYKTQVEKIKLNFDQIVDDKEFWIDKSKNNEPASHQYVRLKLINQFDDDRLSLELLKKNGLKSAPQRAIKIKNNDLENYINKVTSDYDIEKIFPESDDIQDNIYEGAKVSINVNRYERSSVARDNCIEYHGCVCKVCGMDFEKMYGEIGKGFIHVHHIKPLSEINEEYIVDYKKDLIPVCPNCHAMLHRKMGDKFFTVEELKQIIKNK